MRPGELTAEQFSQRLHWLGRHFNVVGLSDGLDALAQARLPARALAISFDDGYANNVTVAKPLLEQAGMTACFFIASDFLDGGIMWNDQVIEALRHYPKRQLDLRWLELGLFSLDTQIDRVLIAQRIINKIKHQHPEQRASQVERLIAGAPLPDNLMMRSEQLIELDRAGFEIGGHTCSHPILTRLNKEQQFAEIATNKQQLERLIGKKLRCFAYPNGKRGRDYDQDSCWAAQQAGYSYALTTEAGVAKSKLIPMEVPRYTPWRGGYLGFMAQLIGNYRSASGAG